MHSDVLQRVSSIARGPWPLDPIRPVVRMDAVNSTVLRLKHKRLRLKGRFLPRLSPELSCFRITPRGSLLRAASC